MLKNSRAPLISKKNPGGYTPGPPLKGGGEGEDREGATGGEAPPIHIPGYATARKGSVVGYWYCPYNT